MQRKYVCIRPNMLYEIIIPFTFVPMLLRVGEWELIDLSPFLFKALSPVDESVKLVILVSDLSTTTLYVVLI
jgi:hypothetical protein